jgi:hypothetical protein
VIGGTLRAGDDADEAVFFPLDNLPPLAFDTDVAYLQSLGYAAEVGDTPG